MFGLFVNYDVEKFDKDLFSCEEMYFHAIKFISKARTSPPLSYILTNRSTIDLGYQLRSGQQRAEHVKGHTERFNNSVTVRFQ